MILTCSKCTTQFTVSATALGERGRKVKCSRCSHTWFQTPENPNSGGGESAIPSPLSPLSPPPAALDREPVVSPQYASTTAAVVVVKQAGPGLKFFTLFLILLMLGSGALVGITKVKHPALAKLQDGLGLADNSGFTFRNVNFKATPSTSPGKMTLVFSGMVKNDVMVNRPSPPVTVTLYDRAGRVVRSLEYQFPITQIDAGKTLTFEPKIKNIPDSLSRVVLELGNNVEQLLR